MENYSNDIYKFNNQYLKCVITKYSSTIEGKGYLANSGSLIIYQPPSEKQSYVNDLKVNKENNVSYNRNYIYLGNEFLASGYGFLCKTMRDDAEKIVNTYDNTIARLDKADKDEQAARQAEDTLIHEKFNKYILIDGGSISKTVIDINGTDVKTRDVILYGQEAQYDNLRITNVIIKINDSLVNDNVVYLPLGSLIRCINISIEYEINDSGGIGKLEVLHKNLKYNYVNDYSNENVIESFVMQYDQDLDVNVDEGVINYVKNFNSNDQLYVTGRIKELIEGFYVYVNETPKSRYKNYPRLEDLSPSIKIKSTGNIIRNNIIKVITGIDVIPLYNFYYTFLKNENEGITIGTYENGKTILLNDDSEQHIILDVDKTSSIMCFALPNIYYVDKVYAMNSNFEKYNWTGFVFEQSNTVKLSLYKNVGDAECYIAPYNLYKLCEGGLFKCEKIIITVCLKKSLTYSNISKDSKYNRSILSSQSISFNDSIKINNEDFNSLYWIKLQNESGDNSKNFILNNATKNLISKD